ncbi:hypothetical protein CRG98_004134 [Punica granatum]|uniref:Uncharacterized protein n=1 Tax=Punica granatum TaxID=22663 RepID=A0A2I0L456_PUNGR|nr:hypothetical protein CRG98_004134 [Punica granatum]
MARRALLLLIFIGILAMRLGDVSAVRSIGLAGLQEVRNVARESTRRVLQKAGSSVERMSTGQPSPSPKGKFDPYTSSKRRVRGGSDPIHNRS